MSLVSGRPLRDACWAMLSQQIRQRIIQRSGEIIEWWADRRDEETRPYAVVVGRTAAVFALPRYNTEHRPVYALETCEFDPGSMQQTSIEHRPRRKPSRGPRTAESAVPLIGPAIKGLGVKEQGVLGNLPPHAQETLQEPFLSNEVLRCYYHWEGYQDRLNMFGVVLIGAKHMTLATGTKLVPVGHDAASAHWSLQCYRAVVIRRRGI